MLNNDLIFLLGYNVIKISKFELEVGKTGESGAANVMATVIDITLFRK